MIPKEPSPLRLTPLDGANKSRPSNGFFGTILSVILLTVAPIVFLFCARELDEKRGPLWLGSNSDPTYVYLFNSLLIANKQPVYHIDHPGTIAQIAGAIILRARYPSLSVIEVNRLVLTQPERALHLIISVINGATSLLLFSFGLLLWRQYSDLPGVLLFQCTLLFFDQTYFASVYFTPEIFFPPLCLGLAYLCFISHDREHTVYFPLVAGLLAALCLMAKYTFVPLLALGLFAFKPHRSKWIYLATFLIIVGVFVCYLHSELSRIWLWVVNLVTHSGQYGGGPKELVNWAHYFPTLLNLLRADPLYLPLLITGFAGPLLTLIKWPLTVAFHNRTNRLLLGLATLEACCFVITAKHPAAHYLMPVVAIAPLHVMLLHKQLGGLLTFPPIRVAVSILALVGGLYVGFKKYNTRSVFFEQVSANQTEGRAKLTAWLNAKDPSTGSVAVHYYRNSSVEYSLYFGDGYARGYFSPFLAKLYPDTWFFNIFNARFANFTETIMGPEFYARHPHPLFFGSNSIEAMPFGLEFPLPANGALKRVWHNAEAAIHEVEYR